MFVGTGVVMALDASLSPAFARRRWSTESSLVAFLGRMLVNIALVGLAEAVLGLGTEDDDTVSTLFFLGLISLVTTLHDRWIPVRALRVRDARDDALPAPTGS